MLKVQSFGHLMRRADALENTLMLGKTEGRRKMDNRGRDGWMASPARWTWVWASSGEWWMTGKRGVLQSMASQSWVQLSNWTTATNSDSYTMNNRGCHGTITMGEGLGKAFRKKWNLFWYWRTVSLLWYWRSEPMVESVLVDAEGNAWQGLGWSEVWSEEQKEV